MGRWRKAGSWAWLTALGSRWAASEWPEPAHETHGGVELAKETIAARWIEEGLWQWGDAGIEVGSLVPEGFQAYARILHLAREWTNDEEARARWSTLTGLLRAFTSTPNLCWFGIWEGYGFIDPKRYKGVTRVQTQQRAYLLYRGPIQAATSFQWEPSWLSPNLWWPDDHAWCVASDIDLEETYVGGSNDCIDRILADGELDARRTTLDARVDKGGDKVSGRT